MAEAVKIENVCRDYGRPGCEVTPDERYTMRFDDIGEEPIFWCAHCGPEALALQNVLEGFLQNNPEGAAKLEMLLNEADAEEAERLS